MLVHWVDICGGGVQGLGQIKLGELFLLHFISVFVTNTKSSRKSLSVLPGPFLDSGPLSVPYFMDSGRYSIVLVRASVNNV